MQNLHLSDDPPCNLVLKNLCEAFLLERNQKASLESEAHCSLHCEKLKLFCLDHQLLVCLVCRDSKIHNKHKFRTIEEAAEDHRKVLQVLLQPLKEKLKHFKIVKGDFDQTREHIKVQALHTERKIKEKFAKMHQFLQEEEKARITALRAEEEQKSQMIKEKMEALSRKIAALLDAIRATEENLRAEDVSFLQNIKPAVNRVQQRTHVVSGALIDVAKHLGNLTFNIWKNMKEMVSCTPVILDPNTAHQQLILSEDLTSVSLGERQQLPNNPERFDHHPIVLGSEGFDSGTHSWHVEVRKDGIRCLGVLIESVKRKEQLQTGFWEICLQDGQYTAAAPPLPDKLLSVKKLQRVKVQLDCDRGKLSFFDLDTSTHIHTFKLSFTEKLFPYIGTHNKVPRKILPVTVRVEQHTPSLSTGFWFS
uniref:zinc-binding protein A33-like n=1 Tax=Maylandia zebra TaxID=106582 RepID=UPI000D2FC020|nr:zinc-binding protein A33-like [Maylandia zebra]